MDLALLMFLGFFALPWYWMGGLFLLFMVDVALCESDEFTWGTVLLMAGVALTAWLGGDINPFTYLWHNFAEIVKFFAFYFAIGGLWSIVKWYFYLLKLRDRMLNTTAVGKKMRTSPEGMRNVRPDASYAANNKGRIMGWIGHWPFSVIGTFLGDFIKRIVTSIYNVLSKLYDRMAAHVFVGFDEE